MEQGRCRRLLGKIMISGKIECLTGLHIGGSQDSMQIGGLSSPVMRDPITKHPYIPGSSLKGKLRSFIERFAVTNSGKDQIAITFNRDIGNASNHIFIHCCDTAEDAIKCAVCRIFGSSAAGRGKDKGSNYPGRLFVRDGNLSNPEYLFDENKVVTLEVKYENSLDRITAAANPRQIERVPAGSKFDFELICDVEKLSLDGATHAAFASAEIKRDLEHLFAAMELLEVDALGGYGTRGSGKIKFKVEQFLARRIDVYLTGVTENNETGIRKDGAEHDLQSCRQKIEEVCAFFEEKDEVSC